FFIDCILFRWQSPSTRSEGTMAMIFRPATVEEVLTGYGMYLRNNWPVSFRHFAREIAAPRARNGVAHRQHSRSRLYVIDGKPHVKHRGKLAEVTATVAIQPSGRENVFDLRLNSEHLP